MSTSQVPRRREVSKPSESEQERLYGVMLRVWREEGDGSDPDPDTLALLWQFAAPDSAGLPGSDLPWLHTPKCGPLPYGDRDRRYARRPLDGSAGYHLWSPTAGLNTCSSKSCKNWSNNELGPAIAAVLVPPSDRCGFWHAPRFMPRPFIGPLPEQWPGKTMPRWYAWWRMHDLQDGTCACCNQAAYAIDHDHKTGMVRGLLCVSCNKRESLCLDRLRSGTHEGEACYQEYWDHPPAEHLGWLYTPGSLRRTS